MNKLPSLAEIKARIKGPTLLDLYEVLEYEFKEDKKLLNLNIFLSNHKGNIPQEIAIHSHTITQSTFKRIIQYIECSDWIYYINPVNDNFATLKSIKIIIWNYKEAGK